MDFRGKGKSTLFPSTILATARLFLHGLGLLSTLMLAGCNSERPEMGHLKRSVIAIKLERPANVVKAMVWGRNERGDAFGRLVSGDELPAFLVNNGDWTFFAMGWTNDVLVGEALCATARSQLSGPKVTQELALNRENCKDSDFRGAVPPDPFGTPQSFGSLQLVFCEAVNAITGWSNKCTDDLDPLEVDRRAGRGHAMSARLVLQTYDRQGSNLSLRPERLRTPCLEMTPSDARATYLGGQPAFAFNYSFPAGDGATTPFLVSLETYPHVSDCNAPETEAVMVNLLHGTRSFDHQARSFTNTMTTKLFVKLSGEEICRGAALTRAFAGGTGDKVSPKLVCSPRQFYNMLADYRTNFSAGVLDKNSHKLLADIDLSSFRKGLPGLPYDLEQFPCLKSGSNFLPLGRIDCDGTTAADHSTHEDHNDFDGGGKAITGLRIIAPQKTRLGLFQRKNFNASIRRVKLINPEVRGTSYIGTLVAINRGEILDSHIVQPRVEASVNYGGGVAGETARVSFEPLHPNALMRNVRVEKAQITGLNIIGGVAGGSQLSDLENVTVSGEVLASGSSVGGIAANHNNGELQHTRFEGMVLGSTYAGGLVGSLSAGTINASYAQAAVVATQSTTGIFTGGLVGAASAGVTLSNSYFYGKIGHRCSDVTTANCRVGNIVGSSGLGTYAGLRYVDQTPVLSGFTASDRGVSIAADDLFDPGFGWGSLDARSSDIPRLPGETATTQVASDFDRRHPCSAEPHALLPVSDQISLGRGNAAAFPILICNRMQFEHLRLSPDKHYRFQSPVAYLTPLTSPTAPDFSGTVDGDGHALIGLRLGEVGAAQTNAFWNSVTQGAKVRNLVIAGATLFDRLAPAGSGHSLLARENYGTIEGLRVFDLRGRFGNGFGGEPSHAGIVRTNRNSGVIRNLLLEGAFTTNAGAGGVTHTNEGIVEDSLVILNFTCSAACQNLAPLALTNAASGILRKIEVRARMTLNSTAPSATRRSLLVTRNEGVIEDIFIEGSSLINALIGGTHAIATANEAGGIIRRVYNQRSVGVTSAGLPDSFTTGASATVGSDAGTVSSIAYLNTTTWKFNANHSSTADTPGVGVCSLQMSAGTLLPVTWQGAITAGTLSSFGLTDGSGSYHPFSALPTQYNPDIFNVTATACPTGPFTVTFLPPDPRNSADLRTPLQAANFNTWLSWDNQLTTTNRTSVVEDVSGIDYPYGLTLRSGPKPTWVFDPVQGMRLHREK